MFVSVCFFATASARVKSEITTQFDYVNHWPTVRQIVTCHYHYGYNQRNGYGIQRGPLTARILEPNVYFLSSKTEKLRLLE